MKAVVVLCLLALAAGVRAFEDDVEVDEDAMSPAPLSTLEAAAYAPGDLVAKADALRTAAAFPGWKKLTAANPAAMTKAITKPACALSPTCFNCRCGAGPGITKHVVTAEVNSVNKLKITALKPFVAAIKAGFDDAIKASADVKTKDRVELAVALREIKSHGGLCCRPTKVNGKPGKNFSNHSWGCAVDLGFGDGDKQGDNKVQKGLILLAPYFNKQMLYWGAAFSNAEDAMHFEASVELLNKWSAAKMFK